MVTPPLADAARDAPAAGVIDAVRTGDWAQLAATLAAAPHDHGGDHPLLACLAEGRCADTPPTLPSYRLLRQVGPALVPALRLVSIASALAPPLAEPLLRIALAFAPSAPAVLVALGWLDVARRATESAAAWARRARAAEPGSIETLIEAGWLLACAGRPDEAEPMLATATVHGPGNARAHLYLGLTRHRAGRPGPAESALLAALAVDPELADAHIGLGWLLADQGRLDEALQHSEHGVLRALTPSGLLLHGTLLARAGRLAAASAVLERALSLAPTDADLRRRVAAALSDAGCDAEALRVVNDGLAHAPDAPALLIARAWLERARGEGAAAERTAEAVLARDPVDAAAWRVKAALREDDDQPAEAEACLLRALAADPADAALVLWRARLIRRQGRAADAAWLVDAILAAAPEHHEAGLLRADLALDLRAFAEARRRLHDLRRAGVAPGAIWWRLGLALAGLDRAPTARYAAQRACRLAPDSAEALELRARLAHAAGDLADAREAVHALIERLPDDAATHGLAVRIALAANLPDEAEHHAMRALALAPEQADGWHMLGLLRRHQRDWRAAEDCLHLALRCTPGRADLLSALGWILVDDDRLAEAEIAFMRAVESAPEDAVAHQALAEGRRLAGRFAAAIAAAERALALQPGWAAARRSRARSRAAAGRHAEASAECADLLRAAPHDRETAATLIELAAADCPAARAALPLIPRALRRVLHREGLEYCVAHGSAAELAARGALARADMPEDAWIAVAALYGDAMTGADGGAALAHRTRDWARGWQLAAGMAPPPRLPVARDRTRLRVAYLASVLHDRLLRDVLAAHDPAAVEVLLYTADAAAARAVLGEAVRVIRLDGDQLENSLLAHRVDVAVDTVGLHPFHGQIDVLRALARRVAPVQCAWLGSWGTGGGIYDVLIADAESVPAHAEPLYDETIVRLPGGQWAWTPPLHAPDPGPPPSRARGHVVFGSTARGFRLTGAVLDAWARLLARVPESRLELLGWHSRSARLRRELDAALRAHGVDPRRVGLQYRRGYADHLAFFRTIDIALDVFPGNSGLGLLDALWMGVPVIGAALDDAGPPLAGARQASSVLRALGQPDWCAASVDDYVATAAALAEDTERLHEIRATLRARLAASPLCDGRRIAAALEAAWRDLRASAQPIAAASDAKARSKAVAQRALTGWLARGESLALPRAPSPDVSVPDVSVPDVSVIVVLFNQAGLTHQALRALADQRDVGFETLIVDNASTDDTPALLDRVAGATILRNPENRHFLAAVNQAAAHAAGRYLLLLNNDAIVQPDALRAAVARLDADPTIGAVGGRIVLGDGRLQEAGCILFGDGATIGHGRGGDPDAPEFRFVRDVDFCSGAFLMVRAALWRALDGFDARFAPAYYEDTDLCLRLRQAGHRVVYDPAILVGHHEWGSAADADAAPEQMRRNRAVFAARHRATLAARPLPAAANPLVERWAAAARPRILVVDNGVPHVARGGGLPRARLLLQALDRHHVTWFPLWQFDDDWRDVAATVPVGTEVMLGLGAERFEAFLAARIGVFDVMLVSRPPNMAWIDRVRRRRPRLFDGMRVVYDAEALFAPREIAQAAALGRPLARAARRRRLRDEIALAGTADRVLAVSQRDARYFAAGGVRDIRVVTHGMAARRDAPGPAGRRGLLFVGALDPGTPNEDGLVWFVDQVMPLLPADTTLSIVGECRSSAVAALASPRVRLLGRVDDLQPVYDGARVFVAPARFAAGVAAKVIEAACHGLPVAASLLLARQLGWSPGHELAGARDPAAFAAAIGALVRDDAGWQRMQAAALARAAAQFDPARFAAAVRDAVAF